MNEQGRKGLVYKLLSITWLLVFASCMLTDRRETKRGSEVENEVYGFLVDSTGRAALGAKVWAHPAKGFPLPSGSSQFSNAATDSAQTNDSGKYLFKNMDPGVYNFIAELPRNGQLPLVAMVPQIDVKISDEDKNLGTDTLRIAGAIKGRITWGGAGREGGIAYLPGTTLLAFSDGNGDFIITGIPQGIYSVQYLLTGFQAEPDSHVIVKSGITTQLADKELGYDASLLPPAPTRLIAQLDTLNTRVRLEWSAIKVSDLLGYLVYRDTGVYSAPALLTPNVITDTVFVDTVSRLIHLGGLPEITYRVVSVDRDKNISVQFSPAAKITLARPDVKQLKLTLKRLGRNDDRISIGDTLKVEVGYTSPVVRMKKVEWWVTGSTSPIRVHLDSGYSGKDTLTHVWHSAGNVYYAVVASNEEESSFPHSQVIRVLQDPPIANAGFDLSAVVGDSVYLKGSAKQEFGTIRSFAWDVGAKGQYKNSLDGSLAFILESTEDSVIACILKVVDDDGNVGLDTVLVEVISNPDLVDLGPDLEASASDTVYLQGRGLWRNLVKWEWDIGGRGQFVVGRIDTNIILPKQDTGRIRCIVKVTDFSGLIDYDTVDIALVPDLPEAILSVDPNPAPQGGMLTLSASESKDKLGRIVQWEWKIGESSEYIASSGTDTTIRVPIGSPTLFCALKVTDDDGHSSIDSLRIDLLEAGTWVKMFETSAIDIASLGNGHIGIAFDKAWFVGRSSINSLDMGVHSSSDLHVWEFHPLDTTLLWERQIMSSPYEWNGKIWMVLYNQKTFKNEFWASEDGKEWSIKNQPIELSDRTQFQIIPFDNKLWIFSGVDALTGIPKSDSWYSLDGISWQKGSENFPFDGVVVSKVAVHDQKIWILGGFKPMDGKMSRSIWNSTNGIEWKVVGEIPESPSGIFPSVTIHDGKIWSVESGRGMNELIARAWHSFDGNTWHKNPDPPGFNTMDRPVLFAFKNRLWLMGTQFTTGALEVWVAP